MIRAARILSVSAQKTRHMVFMLAWLLCVVPVYGQGGRPGGIFEFGAGARPLGMGGAYTAMATDASSIYYNPSGLGLLAGRNVSFMHAELFEGASYDYMGYAQNFGKWPGGWGMQALRLSAGGGESRDEYNNRTGSFGYSETALSFGGGVRGLFFPMLSIGAGIKMVNRDLAGSVDRLMGLDLGAQYGPLLGERLSLGVVAQNIGAFSSGDTSDKLGLSGRLGASYKLFTGFYLAGDVLFDGGVRIGTEYVMGPGALRVGYDRSALAFGGGIKFMKSYQLDVAMLKHETLGMSNRVSVNYYFGSKAKAPQTVVYAQDYLARAQESLGGREYVKALENLDMAMGMDADIRRGAWGEKRGRLERVISGLKLREMPQRQGSLKQGEEQAQEANRAIVEYIEGNDLKSVLLAHSALGYKQNSAFYAELLGLITKLTSYEVRRDEILPRKILVQEKLTRSVAAFYDQKFESAMRQCEEVLLLDGNNALAWSRLGSAYYALGDRERARKAYDKAMELDPSDQQTLDFMKMQGWK